MISKLLTRIFGSRNQRLIRHYQRSVGRINVLEQQTSMLSDAELAARTGELRRRHQEGETLEQLMPEAFAVVREGAKRTLGMRHFDVPSLR
jgi:preprotein translocase subunit SecA